MAGPRPGPDRPRESRGPRRAARGAPSPRAGAPQRGRARTRPPDALAADLAGLVAEHPYRERFRQQQSRAVPHRPPEGSARGVPADAAELVEELGLEPGRELRELERAMLRQDPELAAPSKEPTGRGCLAPPTSLVGRGLESPRSPGSCATRELARDAHRPGGTGKTRLALAVAAEFEQAWRRRRFVDLSPLREPELLDPRSQKRSTARGRRARRPARDRHCCSSSTTSSSSSTAARSGRAALGGARFSRPGDQPGPSASAPSTSTGAAAHEPGRGRPVRGARAQRRGAPVHGASTCGRSPST